jgi:hypothetical protein
VEGQPGKKKTIGRPEHDSTGQLRLHKRDGTTVPGMPGQEGQDRSVWTGQPDGTEEQDGQNKDRKDKTAGAGQARQGNRVARTGQPGQVREDT